MSEAKDDGKGGVLTLTPAKKVPSTMEELFKDWHGKYQMPDDLKDWQDIKPVGRELWIDYPETGSIIYIDFDPSVDAEIQKRRPAVVISNNILAQTSPFAWVVPISHGSFNGEDYPLHVQLDNRTNIDGTVYVEQIKSFDFNHRKWQFVEMLPMDVFDEIRKKAQLVI